ncbi:MAG: general secretion pathway protein GspK [Gemmatimonadales bacterium]
MRARNGFALLLALWLLVLLGTLGAAVLAGARLGGETTRNRILLARAGWAREACVEIALARYAEQPEDFNGPTVPLSHGLTVPPSHGLTAPRPLRFDLGRRAWCRAELTEPESRLNLNRADPVALAALLQSDSLVDAVLDWRDPDTLPRARGAEAESYRAARRWIPRNGPFADIGELLYVRGFDRALVRSLEDLVTTRGSGRLDLNTAPAELLATLPGITPGGAATIAARRLSGRRLNGPDDLLSLLAPRDQAVLGTEYPAFLEAATFQPTSLLLEVLGGVEGSPIVTRATLTVVPTSERLAVIRRETE